MKDKYLCPHCGKSVYSKRQQLWQTIIAIFAGIGIAAAAATLGQLL